MWPDRSVPDGGFEAAIVLARMPLILGAEIFYFHDAYYRGLIGRTLVFNRSLTAGEIAELAK